MVLTNILGLDLEDISNPLTTRLYCVWW